MVREEEKQKKGWFGKKKSLTQTSQHVSRPPTASSYTKSKTTSTTAASATTAGAAVGAVTSATTDDDDLPPRMLSPAPNARTSSDIASGAATPTTPTRNSISTDPGTGTTTPSEEAAAVAHIPKHAGFDLDAMKKIIGQAQENPSELKLPARDVTLSSSPPLATIPPRSPVQRLIKEPEEYGYEYGSGKRSASTPIPPSVLLEQEKRREKEKDNELAKEFARSFSLRDEGSISMAMQRSHTEPVYEPTSPELSTKAPPTLTFGDAFDAPIWGSSSTGVTPTAGKEDSYGLGYNSTGYRSMFASSTPAVQNPFAMSSHSLSVNDYGYNGGFNGNSSGGGGGGGMRGGMGMDTGLSFGAADGTIMNGGTTFGGGGADAWVVPGDYGKKPSSSTSSGFGANPWS